MKVEIATDHDFLTSAWSRWLSSITTGGVFPAKLRQNEPEIGIDFFGMIHASKHPLKMEMQVERVMKILLVRPYFKFFPYDYLPQIPEPLGLEYMAAMVCGKHEVKILDCVAENWENPLSLENEGLLHVGLDSSEIWRRIKGFSPDIVGISCVSSSQSVNVREIADTVKAVDRNIITVVGGAHPSSIPTRFLKDNPSVDIVVVGEGEITFSELVDSIEEGKDLRKVKGICYRAGTITLTEMRENVKDLDSLPFPARDLVPYEEYSKMYLFGKGMQYLRSLARRGLSEDIIDQLDPVSRGIAKRVGRFDLFTKFAYSLLNKRGSKPPLPTSSMITSRGCPNNCYFCAVHSVWGRRYRMRSFKNVVDEIEFLVSKYKVKSILFQDDNVSMSKKRMIEICKEIIRRGIRIEWTTPSGVYLPSLDEEVLQWMKKSGCYRLEFGIESGNQEVLDKIVMKKQDLNYVRKIVQICNELGIQTRGFFVLGLPGETKKTMADTIRFAVESDLSTVKFMIAQPWPGSRLYEDVIEKAFITEDYDYTALRVRTDRPCIRTPDFSPQDVLAIRDIGNKMLSKKSYEKFASELERLVENKH